jgi:hypothetical protein
MFTVGSNYENSHFFIRDRFVSGADIGYMYLHCDGRVINVCEYFESKEAAQKVLDKFYPKPKHVWKHGDVFASKGADHGQTMMYLHPEKSYGKRTPFVVYVSCDTCPYSEIEHYLKGATFLFNIKEKI